MTVKACSPILGSSHACTGSANNVPNVPGANGISPMPNPKASKWAGWEKTKRSGGRPAASAEVIKSLVLHRQRSGVCIEHGDVTAVDDPPDSRQRNIQCG